MPKTTPDPEPPRQSPGRRTPDQRIAHKHRRHLCPRLGKRQDTASQEPDLKTWAERQDRPVIWYRDKFTGRSMERPGMAKLLSNLGTGRVSAVVVWRLDRLGRTAKGLTALFDDLVKSKVNLVSLRDGFDLSTPAGRLMANVLASVAAYETEVRAERVIAGQAAARKGQASRPTSGHQDQAQGHTRARPIGQTAQGRGAGGLRDRTLDRAEQADDL